MDDIALVEIAEGKNELGTDKFDSVLGEATHFVDVVVDVASGQVLEEEVNLELILEDKVHRVYKGMIGLK